MPIFQTIKNRLQGPLAFMMIGQAAIQLGTFLCMPLMSRYIAEPIVAWWSILLSMSVLMQSFAFLKSDLAIVQAESNEERNALFVFGLSMFLGINILSCLFTQGQYFGAHGQPFFWVFFYFSGFSLMMMLQAHELGKAHFKALTGLRISYFLIAFPISIIASFIFGHYALIYGLYAAAWLPALGYLLWSIDIKAMLSVRRQAIQASINKHKKSLGFLSIGAALDALNSHFFILLISFFFAPKLVAAFFFAQRVANAPLSWAYSTLSQYNFRRFETLHQTQQLSPNILIREWLKWGALALPFYALLFFFGEKLMPIVFGAKWDFAGQIIALLALAYLPMFISATTNYGFIVLQKQQITFYFAIFSCLKPLCLFIAAQLNWEFLDLLALLVSFDILFMILRNGILYSLVHNAHFNA